MDYISQYYKNLAEQLQEKLSNLEKQLNEYYVPEKGYGDNEYPKKGGSRYPEKSYPTDKWGHPENPKEVEPNYPEEKRPKYPRGKEEYVPHEPKGEDLPYSDKYGEGKGPLDREALEKMLRDHMPELSRRGSNKYGEGKGPLDREALEKMLQSHMPRFVSPKKTSNKFTSSKEFSLNPIDHIKELTFDKMVEESVKYINKKFLKESDPDPMAEAGARHQDIVNALIDVHASKYPHRRKKDMTPAEASAEHIREVLNKHPSAPFTKVEDAVRAVAPHAIEGNYGLEGRIYDRYPDRAMFGDVSEHPHYERWVMENEEDYMEDLMGELEKRLG